MDNLAGDRAGTGEYSIPEFQSGDGGSQLPSAWSARNSPLSIGPDTPLNLYASFSDHANPGLLQFEYTGLWEPPVQQGNPHTIHDDLCIDTCTGIYTDPAQTPLSTETDDFWAMARLRTASTSVSFTNCHEMANGPRSVSVMGNGPTHPPPMLSTPTTFTAITNTTGRSIRDLANRAHYRLRMNPIRANLSACDFAGGMTANGSYAVHSDMYSTPFGAGDLGALQSSQDEDGSVYSSLCPESRCCYSSRDCLEDHCDGDDCQGDDCYDDDCRDNDCQEQNCQGDSCQQGNCPYVCTNCFPPPQFGEGTPTETPAQATQERNLDFAGQDPCPLPHDQPSNHTRIEHNVAHTLQVLSAQGSLDIHSQSPQSADREGSSFGNVTSFACLWICNPDAPPAERRVCGERFTDAEHLDKHVCCAHTAKLNSRTKYMCLWDGCIRKEDQLFTSRAKLDRHIPTHTGHKPMTCQICQMSLSSQQALEQHMRTHNGEKPFACDKCGKSFTTKSSLITHKRIHDGSKPLRCDVCGKEFGDSSNLSKHKATHQGKTRHCLFPGCGKSFRRNDQLERHQKVHQNGPFPCTFPGCRQTYRRRRQLEEHQKEHNSAERQFSASAQTPMAEIIPAQGAQTIGPPSIMLGGNDMYPTMPLLGFQRGLGKERGPMWHGYV